MVLVALTWSPFSAGGNWLTVLIVVTLVIVGVEMLRRTSLAEAPHDEQASTDPAVATASAESGTDTT
jgi:fumarate reductase subunit D